MLWCFSYIFLGLAGECHPPFRGDNLLLASYAQNLMHLTILDCHSPNSDMYVYIYISSWHTKYLNQNSLYIHTYTHISMLVFFYPIWEQTLEVKFYSESSFEILYFLLMVDLIKEANIIVFFICKNYQTIVS